MTNSSPEPPELSESSQPKKRILDSDEWIAIIVAFTTIGAILFWSLGTRKESFLAGRWQQIWAWKGKTEKTAASFDSSTSIEDKSAIDSSVPKANLIPLPEEIPPIVAPKTELKPKISLSEESLESSSLDTDQEISAQPEVKFPVIPLPTPTKQPETEATKPKTPLSTIPESQETPEPVIPKIPETKPSEPAKTPETLTPEAKPKQPTVTFKDVPQDHWASPFIYSLATKELIQSTSDNIFEPNKPINRAQMAILIGEAFEPEPSLETKSFKDVSESSEIALQIERAVRAGFMRGYASNHFRPQENIPRYQVLVALVSGLNLQPVKDVDTTLQIFKDAEQIPNWARNQVAAAIENGLVVNPPGIEVTSLKPNQAATRAEVAAMIHQALVKSGKVEEVFSEYIVPSP
jgi:hypothetical protein